MTHGMSARFEEMVYAERQMIQDLKQENQLLRDKIAELEAEKDARLALFNVCRGSYDTLLKQQIELDQQLAEKDTRIAELEAKIWRLQDGIRRIATKDL
jgi:peptidoglycan hydrolase CwlO-like protein